MTCIRKRPRKVLPAVLRPPSISERFTTVLVTLADVPRWYHIYSTESYRANDARTFSHGWGDTRFSPITDAADEIVDTYYLASTVEGAFMESILHDVPIPGGNRQVPSAQAIAYGSRRDDSARCLMLFRQRMSSVPFKVISDDCVADAPARRQSIIALAVSLGLNVI